LLFKPDDAISERTLFDFFFAQNLPYNFRVEQGGYSSSIRLACVNSQQPLFMNIKMNINGTEVIIVDPNEYDFFLEEAECPCERSTPWTTAAKAERDRGGELDIVEVLVEKAYHAESARNERSSKTGCCTVS
jgi:hypothetical protein